MHSVVVQMFPDGRLDRANAARYRQLFASAGLDRVDRAPAATAAGAEVRRARLPGCPLMTLGWCGSGDYTRRLRREEERCCVRNDRVREGLAGRSEEHRGPGREHEVERRRRQ